MSKIRLLLLLAFAFVGPRAAMAADPGLTGAWYGADAQQIDGTRASWFGKFGSDGRYVMEYHWYRGCDLMRRATHEGRWSLKDGVFSTDADYVDGRFGGPSARYTMLSLTAETMNYKSLRTGNSFDAKRVAGDFKFPNCTPSS
ncbi:hypothetical protein ACFSM5_07615 [Lacibacterium aquatile]|uniref:Uncharacterized protein n=1 Tax=Lacibacterium aquatile TaxID=1168082 RepID=A0ABW5DP09_9PROT